MAKKPTHPFSDLFSRAAASSGTLSAGEIRTACIEELKEHYDWYDAASRRQKILWFTATIVSAVLGIGVTVAVALNGASKLEGRVAISVASAIATGLTSLLATFATRDAWQLREEGRIAVNELMARACQIPDHDPKGAVDEAIKLLNDAHMIERAQAKGFFGFLTKKSDGQPSPGDREKNR